MLAEFVFVQNLSVLPGATLCYHYRLRADGFLRLKAKLLEKIIKDVQISVHWESLFREAIHE